MPAAVPEPSAPTDTADGVAHSDEPSVRTNLRDKFEPLFAGTGGIDSWLGDETPIEVFERLAKLPQEHLSRTQLSQLLILSHEAGFSEGFFKYYWCSAPPHTYSVTTVTDDFDAEWVSSTAVVSLGHLRWGLYRFYVDALLYFGNVRSAYRTLRDKSAEELTEYFVARRMDTDGLRARDVVLPLRTIAKDDRYLVAEMACKSFDAEDAESLEEAAVASYRNHVAAGGSPVVSVDELLKGEFIAAKYKGRQQQFVFSADDILDETVANEGELRERLKRLTEKFGVARAKALQNTKLYLSMVETLDVYVATSMRTRDNFRRVAEFCEEVFEHEELREFNLRYFDPTLSAADGHVDKGLIECLMVDAASALVYVAGDRESLGKDFEAAMALSRGKPVIFMCEDADKERLYREIHPLTRLIDFESGVAIGTMVATSAAEVRELLRRWVTNTMMYEIQKTDLGALHLVEQSTRSLVRLQTHDKMLQETFWNYYHRRGALA